MRLRQAKKLVKLASYHPHNHRRRRPGKRILDRPARRRDRIRIQRYALDHDRGPTGLQVAALRRYLRWPHRRRMGMEAGLPYFKSHWVLDWHTLRPHPFEGDGLDFAYLHAFQLRVAATTVRGFFVSTIFLGLNTDGVDLPGGPRLFETMVEKPDGGWMWQHRRSSRHDALVDHATFVARLSEVTP